MRSVRTEESTCSSNPRNSFSGVIGGRPVAEHNLLNRGYNRRKLHPPWTGTAAKDYE